MKSLLMILLLFPATIIKAIPGGDWVPAGGRAAAMGGTSVAHNDFWSLANNQAGTAWIKNLCAGMGFENHFLSTDFMYQKLGLIIPSGAGTFGVVAERAGNEQYIEFKAALSYARRFGKHFSVGVALNYIRIHIAADYGSRSLLTCGIGMMFLADKHLTIGVHLDNPVPIKITDAPTDQLPPLIRLGLSYMFSGVFLTSLEIEKDQEHPVVIKTGAEYRITKVVFVRIGVSTSPMIFSFGCGLEFGRLLFDMASGYHQDLGFSPSGSIIYTFRKSR
jgi:hypothetical protein